MYNLNEILSMFCVCTCSTAWCMFGATLPQTTFTIQNECLLQTEIRFCKLIKTLKQNLGHEA